MADVGRMSALRLAPLVAPLLVVQALVLLAAAVAAAVTFLAVAPLPASLPLAPPAPSFSSLPPVPFCPRGRRGCLGFSELSFYIISVLIAPLAGSLVHGGPLGGFIFRFGRFH